MKILLIQFFSDFLAAHLVQWATWCVAGRLCLGVLLCPKHYCLCSTSQHMCWVSTVWVRILSRCFLLLFCITFLFLCYYFFYYFVMFLFWLNSLRAPLKPLDIIVMRCWRGFRGALITPHYADRCLSLGELYAWSIFLSTENISMLNILTWEIDKNKKKLM